MSRRESFIKRQIGRTPSPRRQTQQNRNDTPKKQQGIGSQKYQQKKAENVCCCSTPQQYPEASSQPRQLQPGDVLYYDGRPKVKRMGYYNGDDPSEPLLSRGLCILQWNIERGYKLNGILNELQPCHPHMFPDILLIQEVDINCKRTQYINVAQKLALELQMLCVFVCEFIEIDDECRSQENCVGDGGRGGKPKNKAAYHGNCILSGGWDLLDVEVIKHFAPFSWEKAGRGLCEPREGCRFALYARIHISKQTGRHNSLNHCDDIDPEVKFIDFHFYCAHLEVFCGALARVRQLGDVFQHTHQILARSRGEEKATKKNKFIEATNYFCVAGDLNTMAHGIVRLSGKYGTDRMKILGIGETEAEWLWRKFLKPPPRTEEPLWNERTQNSDKEEGGGNMQNQNVSQTKNDSNNNVKGCWDDSSVSWWEKLQYSLLYGLSTQEMTNILYNRRDPGLHLIDPFHRRDDITLDHPGYHGFVRGKLDWLLLSPELRYCKRTFSRGDVGSCGCTMGNHEFTRSDHKYLMAHVFLPWHSQLVKEKELNRYYQRSSIRQLEYENHHRSSLDWLCSSVFARWFWRIAVLLLVAVFVWGTYAAAVWLWEGMGFSPIAFY